MDNKKKFALILSMIMALGGSVSVLAKNTDKIDVLQKEGYVQGYNDGDLKLDNKISRAEMLKLLVYANGGEELAKSLQSVKGPFTDVDINNPFNGVINAAASGKLNSNGLKMINGYPDGTFKPESNVKPAELAKMMVILSDKNITEEEIKNADKSWPNSWINKSKEEKIFDKNFGLKPNEDVTREDAFNSFYNALNKLEKIKNPVKEQKNLEIAKTEDIKKEYTKTKSKAVTKTENKSEIQKEAEKRDYQKEINELAVKLRNINKLIKEKYQLESSNKEKNVKIENDKEYLTTSTNTLNKYFQSKTDESSVEAYKAVIENLKAYENNLNNEINNWAIKDKELSELKNTINTLRNEINDKANKLEKDYKAEEQKDAKISDSIEKLKKDIDDEFITYDNTKLNERVDYPLRRDESQFVPENYRGNYIRDTNNHEQTIPPKTINKDYKLVKNTEQTK